MCMGDNDGCDCGDDAAVCVATMSAPQHARARARGRVGAYARAYGQHRYARARRVRMMVYVSMRYVMCG